MSELTLVIGNKNYSSWSLRPWFFLKQHDIPFTEKWVSLYTPDSDTQLEHYGSDCKVPILVDDERVVWDSLAILEYLSEQYLEGRGWPSDAKARAVARSISNEMHSSFFNVREEMPMNVRRSSSHMELSPAALREVGRIKALWQRCRKEFGGSGKWLFGDFSIADAMYAPIVFRFHSYAIPMDGLEKEYEQTILNNPAIQEWRVSAKLETDIIADAERD